MAHNDAFTIEPRQQFPEGVLTSLLKAYLLPGGPARADREYLIAFWMAEIAATSRSGVVRQLQYLAAGTRAFTPRSQRIFARFITGERLRQQQERLNDLLAQSGVQVMAYWDPSLKKIVFREIWFGELDRDEPFDFYDKYAYIEDGIDTLLLAEEERDEQFMEAYGAPLIPVASDAGQRGIEGIPDWTIEDRDTLILQWSVGQGPVAPPWPPGTDTIPELEERIGKVRAALRENEKVSAAERLVRALGLSPEQIAALKKVL